MNPGVDPVLGLSDLLEAFIYPSFLGLHFLVL